MSILVVDDSPTNLVIMRRLISSIGAKANTFSDPLQALEQAPGLGTELAVVDYSMPSMNGLDLVQKLKETAAFKDMPFVMVTANEEISVRHAALEAGVTDFIRRPIDPVEVKSRLRNLLRLIEVQRKLENRAAHLADEVAAATRTIASREEEIILRLARASEYRDGDTGAHIVRMARYTKIIAERLGLSAAKCRLLYLAASMHDVGKIGVPDSILLKPGKLTPEERTEMEKHTLVGEAILKGSSSELIRLAREIAGTHHEKWDGTGYPRQLRAREIPLAGRIAAVADVFDALTMRRPYKHAWTPDEARERMLADSGKHFDPECIEAFVAVWPQVLEIHALENDASESPALQDSPALERPLLRIAV